LPDPETHLEGGAVGNWVSYWFVAFVVTLILSIACVGGLLAGWGLTPESIDWETTDAGKLLLRARLLFVIACGVIFGCLFALIYLENAPLNSPLHLWCDEHRYSLPLLLAVSSGLSALSSHWAVSGKGDGRRVLLVGTLVIAVLSFVAAGYLTQFLSQ
jgi:hypothetical protein